tara:strand:+ start:2332 stop:2469 length:138 start_codon:yes stop_codon:yes gene_type:complete
MSVPGPKKLHSSGKDWDWDGQKLEAIVAEKHACFEVWIRPYVVKY